MLSRALCYPTDIPTLQAFLAEMRQEVAQAGFFQLGDLLFRIHYWRNEFNAETDLRIWPGEGNTIDGFVFDLTSDNNPEFFLRPALYDAPIADEMVEWVMDAARRNGKSTLETSCIDGDEAKAAFLHRHGFQKTVDVMVFMARSLDEPIPNYELPPGYEIVSQADRPHLPGANTPMMAAQHAMLYNAWGYYDDLGLRVCYQDQEIVSGGVCWYDDVDNCGEFEPVGTAKEHRGKGLAFAVLSQMLMNLRRHGAKFAYVRTDKDNEPAVRLYQKLGFQIMDEDYGWVLKT